METLEKICQEVALNPHVLTFSDISQDLLKGAIAGHKSKIPGGAVTGAVLALSLEAGERVVLITEDLLDEKRNKKRCG